MKLFAFIIIFTMLYATVIPCHAAEHDHHGKCSHHENHDMPSDSEDGDDHPCSPFCGYHSSVSNHVTTPNIIYDHFITIKKVEKTFIYTPTYFYLQEFSIWNPPKA